jgi:N-succinyldiaminopimelate aminotransferase
LRLGDEFFAGTAATLQRKRDLLSAGLQSAGFTVGHPQGGYFVIADAAPLGHTDAAAFCRELPSLAGVVGVPLSAFVLPDHRAGLASLVRFAFCKRESVLEQAAERLAALQPRRPPGY